MSHAILIIDDTSSVRQQILDTLQGTDLFSAYFEAGNGLEGLKIMLNEKIDIVLCDVEMPGMDGFNFLAMVSPRKELQDIPILLQLFFWYAFFYEILPQPRQAINVFEGMFLCNRGLIFAIPAAHPAFKYMAVAFLIGCLAIYLMRRWARKRQDETGRIFMVFKAAVGILIGLPLITWLTAGAPTL